MEHEKYSHTEKAGFETESVIEFEVDSGLLKQVKRIIGPRGMTIEDLTRRFLDWLIDLETQDKAIAWVKKGLDNQ